MGIYMLRDRKYYWATGGPFSVEYKFNAVMQEKTWRRIWSVLEMPPSPEASDALGTQGTTDT
jgi:hypothetical protein